MPKKYNDYGFRKGLPLDSKQLSIDPRDRGLLPLAKLHPIDTPNAQVCEHVRLHFAEGCFQIVCFDCKQEWVGVRRDAYGSRLMAYDLGEQTLPSGMRFFDKKTSNLGDPAKKRKTPALAGGSATRKKHAAGELSKASEGEEDDSL